MSQAQQTIDAAGPPQLRFMIAAILLLLALKSLLALAAPPLGDEAYYWMWGQYLDWSYHDHPPLNAWLLRLSADLFGWNRFALRLPAMLAFAASAAIICWWAPRLAPHWPPRHAAAAAMLVVLASPLFFVFQTVAFPDYLLIALSLAAGHFFVLYIRGAEEGRPSTAKLLAAAICIGLAALAKYSALFVGLGFVAWCLSTPAGRRELASPRPWLAGAVALALQAPVLWWNWRTGFSSFAFHFSGRMVGSTDIAGVAGRLAAFLGPAAAMLSPFLLPGLVRLVRRGPAGDAARFRAIAIPAFVLAMTVFSALTLLTTAYFYWTIPAVVLFVGCCVAAVGARMLRAHAIYGSCVAALLTAHMAIIPLTAPFGIAAADDISFGWSDIAARVEVEAETHDAPLLLASQYNLAALLGFQLRRTDVFSLTGRAEQYDHWFDPSDHAGKDAVVISDADRPIDSGLRDLFDTVEQIGTVTSTRLGLPVHTYSLHVARGLRGDS